MLAGNPKHPSVLYIIYTEKLCGIASELNIIF
jgi:hypothetical protein